MNIFIVIIETIKTAGIVLLLLGAVQIERRIVRIERALRAARAEAVTEDDLPEGW